MQGFLEKVASSDDYGDKEIAILDTILDDLKAPPTKAKKYYTKDPFGIARRHRQREMRIRRKYQLPGVGIGAAGGAGVGLMVGKRFKKHLPKSIVFGSLIGSMAGGAVSAIRHRKPIRKEVDRSRNQAAIETLKAKTHQIQQALPQKIQRLSNNVIKINPHGL